MSRSSRCGLTGRRTRPAPSAAALLLVLGGALGGLARPSEAEIAALDHGETDGQPTLVEMCLTPVDEMTPEATREFRLRGHASRAVFMRYFNVTTGLVSPWGHGEKLPRGVSLKNC